nr:immunoglobulin light chain junction region [Macaca mulatta]MPN94732.1 immunoglobulin light chain junction region [Macaca mulatta]
CQRYNSLPFTF